ncbi:hypothetical protein [Pseudogemmobacter humi]|uniref:Lipoprotein n=1 Tax=Pseudogemmobacter humi TaxID=2483812 RepID=A0A3P5XDU7_9RHOB|nr:hypothetical protein [Pseudogemmobacter humi]VDC32933.1 hypothetical protein XINFAN_03484 [Pseudogemmobacter humi]
MKHGIALICIFLVAACVGGSGPVQVRPKGQASNTTAVKHCELVNGPVGCNDMRYQAAADYAKALELDYEDTPSRNLSIMEAMLEQTDILIAKSEGRAYDPPGGRPFRAYEDIVLTPVTPQGSSSSGGSGGGCVYQGREYGPGESVYSPINSDSLFVFGKRFSDLAGSSGPWQQCQCSSSSGHWGCV